MKNVGNSSRGRSQGVMNIFRAPYRAHYAVIFATAQLSCYYGAVKCRLIGHYRGQALLLRVLHVVTCDNVRDCVFLKDDLNREKKGLNSYELNFSLPTNSQNKLTKLN